MREIKVTKYGIIHYHAICENENCNFTPTLFADGMETTQQVRNAVYKHIRQTGHTVSIVSGTGTRYRLKEILMNRENIFLEKDAEGIKLKGSIHAQHNAMDYTLCGMGYTLCGMGHCEEFEYTNKKINCPTCIEIIEYCKTFKRGKHYE